MAKNEGRKGRDKIKCKFFFSRQNYSGFPEVRIAVSFFLFPKNSTEENQRERKGRRNKSGFFNCRSFLNLQPSRIMKRINWKMFIKLGDNEDKKKRGLYKKKLTAAQEKCIVSSLMQREERERDAL